MLEVTEAALVRDILYVFQGIDGKNIKMSHSENCYKVEGKVWELDPDCGVQIQESSVGSRCQASH